MIVMNMIIDVLLFFCKWSYFWSEKTDTIYQIIFYEDRNFQGRSYECSSDCTDLHSYFSHCNSIRVESGCFMIYERGLYRLRLYEKPDFIGHMMEFMDDCSCVSDRFHHRHVYSCKVMNGYWIFYEYPNYRGRQYFLKPGDYRRYRDWCATCSIVGSFRRITDF
ncbi:hypothetical protein QTP86_008623 [Hemibagrus guttatus]|nr:hypothetical protein QTP86_008623 [Hemibagrus guttatus]